MSEKYIDLTNRIRADIGGNLAPTVSILRWLDRNPGQVPGRTITRSEYRDTLNGAVKVSGYGDDWERGFCTGLRIGGTKVVPDPEPTNAEKLVRLLKDAVPQTGEGISWESAAQKLDEAGVIVTAPGGDDE